MPAFIIAAGNQGSMHSAQACYNPLWLYRGHDVNIFCWEIGHLANLQCSVARASTIRLTFKYKYKLVYFSRKYKYKYKRTMRGIELLINLPQFYNQIKIINQTTNEII